MDPESFNTRRLAYSIAEACELTSLGRTHLFKLISEGRLATRKIGGRRLVLASSLQELVEGGNEQKA